MRPSGDTARGLVFDDFVDKQVVHVSATSFRSGAELVSMGQFQVWCPENELLYIIQYIPFCNNSWIWHRGSSFMGDFINFNAPPKWTSWHIFFLTHWGRDKMAALFQTTFSNAFSWMKMYQLMILTIQDKWVLGMISRITRDCPEPHGPLEWTAKWHL